MATIVLSAVGAAAGSAVGGSVLGMSSAVVGRAIGASLGRSLDARLMGRGSEAVLGAQAARFRVQSAGEGDPVGRVFGRCRVGGQVIWVSRFKQVKGARAGEMEYCVSLAIALCEGEISRVGRIWADGTEIAGSDLNMRVYKGTQDQLPDLAIEAIEGAGHTPAYRGIAYVVFADLFLGQFGDRVPQFNFEVTKPTPSGLPSAQDDLSRIVRAVAMIPGTGEYALATTPVHFDHGLGQVVSANTNNPSGETDFSASLDALNDELPNCGSVSLVASWFADDLRCGQAQVMPKVEQQALDGVGMPWSVSGVDRANAVLVPKISGVPVYGGTPADASVIEAIQAINSRGLKAVFYPFLLMDQLSGNGLTDPWTGAPDQPALPWRGRITTSLAPGVSGSPDGSAAAVAEVASFFGTAGPNDFAVVNGSVIYDGPDEWSFRRMILHYAHLCVAAGGVDAFCIGSELRGLTQIRGPGNSFPAVDALCALVSDVRSVMGPTVKLGYAADWSEYFGYHPQDGSGDVYFHLDPLWAHPEIDFVGIDNYMPLSDWRDGEDHADAHWGSIYEPDYLRSNIEGGEGYDWYYADDQDADQQVRSPITDGAYGEDWIYRYKDIRSWWSQYHYQRIGGVRASVETEWVPQSKPIWFTEIGCAAVDKGTNQPNKFVDAKSSESSLPRYSDGRRDDLIQMQYLVAVASYWNDPAQNPISAVYDGPMVDVSRAHVWAWDARPFPAFPNQRSVWADAENYRRGHWLNGRSTNRSLASVVEEIALGAGVQSVNVAGLHGLVRGFELDGRMTPREALQPLLLAHGVDAHEAEGALSFSKRTGAFVAVLDEQTMAVASSGQPTLEFMRSGGGEAIGRVGVEYIDHGGNFTVRVLDAARPETSPSAEASTSLPISMTADEAFQIAHRWLIETDVGQDIARFALPMSKVGLAPGDVVAIGPETYRIDRLTHAETLDIEAVRVESAAYAPVEFTEEAPVTSALVPALPVFSQFLDLPIIFGNEIPHAPFMAMRSDPWQGSVAVFSSVSGAGFTLLDRVHSASVIGQTTTELGAAETGLWDRGAGVTVHVPDGTLESRTALNVLNGANWAAIGDGSTDNWEIIQFQTATLTGPDQYLISGLLRGQAGTDALDQANWPAGSMFVLLDGNPAQLDIGIGALGLDHDLLVGPARKPYSDASYTYTVQKFSGVGLRPFSPVHLRAVKHQTGDVALSWVRRTRTGGDVWSGVDVPLGEEQEQYLVRILQGGEVKRHAIVNAPAFTYSDAMQISDGVSGIVEYWVAQISASYGAGLFGKGMFDV